MTIEFILFWYNIHVKKQGKWGIEMIIIIGAGGSGKSTLQEYLISKKGFTRSLATTTRGMRKGEKNGIDYHFISDEEFAEMNKNNQLLCVERYNNWGYATQKSELEKPNAVAILTPQGAKTVKDIYQDKATIIYLDVDRRSRLINMLQTRDDIDECIRRNIADYEMFKNAEDIADIIIKNDGYQKNVSTLANEVCSAISSRLL